MKSDLVMLIDRIRSLILCACLLGLIGCKPKSPGVTGQWTATDFSSGAVLNADFKPDGNYVFTYMTPEGPAEVDGTYVYEDEIQRIQIMQTAAKVNGIDVARGVPSGPVAPVIWKGADQVTMQTTIGQLTLKRNKS